MRRWAAGLLALAALPPLALAVAHTLLERGAFTPRIDAALEAATGRAVALGRIGIALSLPPRITIDGATIANLPGGSRPDFARIGRMEMRLATRPLLAGRIIIRELQLQDADLLLERDGQGRANWVFGQGGSGGSATTTTIDLLRIRNSRVAAPLVGAIDVASLTLRRRDGGLELTTSARWREEALSLDATLGPPAGPARSLRAEIQGQGLRLAAQGSITTPLADPGWSLAAEASVASTARLAQLLGLDAAPPDLGAIGATATISPGPVLADITLRSGASQPLPGLRITEASLAAAAPDQPITLTLQGSRGMAFSLAATLPSAQDWLASQPATAMPLTASLSAGAARITAQGAPSRQSGLSDTPFDVTLTAPELAALGPLFGVELPSLRGVDARARVTRGADAWRLANARLTAEPVQAEGQLDITTSGPRPMLRGRISAQRLDLDALAPGGSVGASTAGRLIPDIALPIGPLLSADASLALSIASLRAAGFDSRAVSAALTLEAGRLALREITATTPGGPIAGAVTLNAAADPPAATLALRSTGQGFDLAALRRARGAGAGIEGPAEIAFDLRGQGATTRALAASLSGEAGLAMIEGRISRAGMFNIGPNLTRILIPGGPPMEGIDIRCLALRLTAREGLAESRALLLEGSAGRIEGSIAINLRDETLAAHLLPDIRLLGVNTRAPVSVGGTLSAPQFGVDAGQALAQVLSDTIANRLWRSSTVEWLRAGQGEADDCAAALRLARLGREGRVPAAVAPGIIPILPRELQSPVQDVLRGIGGLGQGLGQGIGQGIGQGLGLGIGSTRRGGTRR